MPTYNDSLCDHTIAIVRERYESSKAILKHTKMDKKWFFQMLTRAGWGLGGGLE